MKKSLQYLLLGLAGIPVILFLTLLLYVYFGPVFNQPAGDSVKIAYVDESVGHAWITVKEYQGKSQGVPQFGKHMGQRQYDSIDTYGVYNGEEKLIKQKDDELNIVVNLHTSTEPGKKYAVIFYTDKNNDGFHFNETMIFYDTFVAK